MILLVGFVVHDFIGWVCGTCSAVQPQKMTCGVGLGWGVLKFSIQKLEGLIVCFMQKS